jgi:hypothetical protein
MTEHAYELPPDDTIYLPQTAAPVHVTKVTSCG